VVLDRDEATRLVQAARGIVCGDDREATNADTRLLDDDNRAFLDCAGNAVEVCEQKRGLRFRTATRKPEKGLEPVACSLRAHPGRISVDDCGALLQVSASVRPSADNAGRRRTRHKRAMAHVTNSAATCRRDPN
jgi:hypothetical protein